MNMRAWLERCWRWSGTVFVAGAVVLAGCTSQPLVGNYVAPQSECCSSIEDFDFHTIQLGQDVKFSIASGNATFPFSGRRKHFAAFKVADGFAATSIHVKSYLSSELLPMATAVVPEFAFYDASLVTIGRSVATDAQSAGDFWRSAISSRASVPPGTRYIVVTAGDGSNGFPILRSENGTRHRIPPAALGDLSLRLFGETVR